MLMPRREVGNVFRAAEINGETWRIIKASSCIFYYLFIDTFISKINCLAPVTGCGTKGKRMGKLWGHESDLNCFSAEFFMSLNGWPDGKVPTGELAWIRCGQLSCWRNFKFNFWYMKSISPKNALRHKKLSNLRSNSTNFVENWLYPG